MAISVDYYEMDGWPRELYSLRGFAAERKLKCAWSDRHTLATQIISYGNNVYPYNNSGAVVTHLPRVEGLKRGKQSQGASVSLASYEQAVLIVNYSTYGPATGTTPTNLLITEWTETWSEFKTLNRTEFRWGTGDDAKPLGPGEGPSKIEPGMDYILLYHELNAVPAAVLTQPGTVNSGPVTAYLLGITFPTETILYMGAQINHRITSTGGTAHKVRYRFRYVAHVQKGIARGWNWYWNAAEGEYQQVYDDAGNVKKTYDSANFAF